MGNVYRQQSQRLCELLDKASAPSGATMLIPDLQRPFIWKPNQVTLLIDSLIRGWPFGTLLLWRVNHQELQGIPFRRFWTVVDCTEGSDGVQVAKLNPPAEYHMILDGQQRVQSLLLALGGDDWGFKLEDREWSEETNERRPRGRHAKYPHWSKASLCLDLQKFIAEYNAHGARLLDVDFTKVLTWAVTDPQGGLSSFEKPENYVRPLRRAYDPENQQGLIRLGRLWKEVPPDSTLMEADFRRILGRLLTEHGLSSEAIEKMLQPLGQLMVTLRDVKLADVTFLELQPFNPQVCERDAYNDAIVNIFTRLNTAGRTLTREQITFAWLKVGWKAEAVAGRSAENCFADLRSKLEEDNGVPLEMDDLIRAASFVWSVSKDGRLLANSDLLKGDVIRPMASDLSLRWEAMQEAFIAGVEALRQRHLGYGTRGQFSSLNALAVLWGWLYVAETWKADHRMSETDRDDFEKKCSDSIAKYLDRWIMCSQWAGVWSRGSTSVIEGYAKDLDELRKTVGGLDDASAAHGAWHECFGKFVENLATEAANYINSVSAASRERVGLYRNLLWVWHRVDSERWKASRAQLRVGKKTCALEVDHTVSCLLWERKLNSALPKGITSQEEAAALVHKLGNCALLEKNFNISKSDKALKDFLEKIHEVKQKKIRIDALCAALALPKSMLDPDAASVDEIAEAIENRDKAIRADLVDFIGGRRIRVDVDASLMGTPMGDGREADEEEASDEPPLNRAAPGSDVNFAGLRAAYQEDELVRLVIDHFASRENNQTVTKIDTFVGVLERAGTPAPKSTIVRAFRRLDALGVGRFIVGKRGHATRFEWQEKSLSVRGLATMDGSQPAPEQPD